MIELEDHIEDVFKKAHIGAGLSLDELSHLSGVSAEEISSLQAGRLHKKVMQNLAPHLNLHPEKWTNLPQFQPNSSPPTELHTFTSPFGELGVNSYAIETHENWLIFDTGTEASDLIETTKSKPRQLFITHNHPDHIACLHDIAHIDCFLPGQLKAVLTLNDITITPLSVPGHAYPATAYFIEGLTHPLCVSGDSLFAGSMGGCPNVASFKEAKQAIKSHILSLPGNTIICPGHGPMTTVELELKSNPFFSLS